MNRLPPRLSTLLLGSRTACVVLALAAVAPLPAAAQWLVGVQAGLPAFTVAGDAPEEAGYGRQLRFMASGLLGYSFGSSFVLRVEPGFVQRGTAVSYSLEGVEQPVDSLSLSLDYLSVPIVAQVFTPGGRGFATLGVEVGILSSATLSTRNGSSDEDVKDLLRTSDVSASFGAGGLVRRSQPQVAVELRYVQSLGRVLEDTSGSATPSSLPEGFRSSGLQLTAGLSWTLGGGR